ncbi:hypothetical protein SIO70_14620 [Chitinophaga sancti]|uniref:hypothetical protein n=1 Tax=Chitinophaga sancti TaxID=1004 RepID=UPI002A7498EA|nr:hypothetical protein [Chitinophaga sancti]WPQ66093.1 hypothetical protein SIO70_14620 [Chitinophaga sancti]
MHTAFGEYFPEIANRETRVLTFMDKNLWGLPAGSYALIDLYCTDLDCDCRNVYINIVSERSSSPIATITYGWESLKYYKEWMGNEEDDKMLIEFKGPALVTFANQSKFAGSFLEIFQDILNNDKDYANRLKRHYQLVKDYIKDKPVRR